MQVIIFYILYVRMADVSVNFPRLFMSSIQQNENCQNTVQIMIISNKKFIKLRDLSVLFI